MAPPRTVILPNEKVVSTLDAMHKELLTQIEQQKVLPPANEEGIRKWVSEKLEAFKSTLLTMARDEATKTYVSLVSSDIAKIRAQENESLKNLDNFQNNEFERAKKFHERFQKNLVANLGTMLDEALKSKLPTEILVKQSEEDPGINVGLQHKLFPKLLKILNSCYHGKRLAIYLVGPAGSGKSEAGIAAAKALGLPFYGKSVSNQTNVAELLGFKNATGVYTDTLLFEAYSKGGIYLLDEIDKGNPNTLAVLNTLASSSAAPFPHAVIPRHKDFCLMAAANTFGLGADRKYVGSNQIDAATLDRFVFMEWGYDEQLEEHLTTNHEWLKTVRKYRQAVEKLGIRHVISPRASFNGSALLESGFTQEEAIEMAIMKGLSKDEKLKLTAAVG